MTSDQGYYGQRRVLRVLQGIGLFLLFCWLMISCGRTPPVNETNLSQNQRIVIGTTLKIRTIDPADAYENLSAQLLYNLGDRLYTYASGTTQLIPQLATELPRISEDGLVYTIPLRQGVFFHDGNSFNASAMEFAIQRFIKNGGRPSFLLSDLVSSVKATGEYELEITLKKPFSAFPALLTFPGLSAISPQAYEIGEGKFKPDSFVGTGPYKLAKYRQDSLVLEAFKDYWGEKSVNQEVGLQLLSSPVNLFNSFRTKAVDVAYLSLDPDQINNLEAGVKQGKFQRIEGTSNTVSYMVLNLKSQPLDNLKVRQAIALMIDRSLINNRALRGQAQPLYSLIPTTFTEVYKPVFKTEYGDGKFSQAKDLLKQAGFSTENPAKLQLWYPTGSTRRSLVAMTLKALAQKYLEGVLKVEINTIEAATLYQNLEKGIYPAVLLDWYADFFDADNYVQPFLECNQGSPKTGCEKGASQGQGSFFYREKANQLIDQQRREINPKIRQEILGELQDILAEDIPYIPLWQDKDYTFYQTGIQGVKLEPTQFFPFGKISKSFSNNL